MSAHDQELKQWALQELTSDNPKRRSAAAQRLVSSLDFKVYHTSEVDKKEAQLKHTYTAVASAPQALSFSWFMSCFMGVDDSAQVSLLRALRDLELGQLSTLERSEGLLSWALTARAPKVRQRCAQVLSAHPILPVGRLREALWAEEVYFVRSSLILSLGRLSAPEALTTLEEWAQRARSSGEPLGAQERAALLKARSALSHLRPDPAPTLSLQLAEGQPVVWCAPQGLEAPLCAELSQGGWRSPALLSDDQRGPLDRIGLVSALPPVHAEGTLLTAQAPLARPRCSEGLALLISARLSRGDEPRARRLDQLLSLAERALKSSSSLNGHTQALEAPFTYRVDLAVKRREAHRALLTRCRALMSALFPQAIESPSDYQAQLTARFGERDALILRLDALSDRQGPLRVADVGASMAQPVASAVARHAQQVSAQLSAPHGAPYVILDPTCGSGTLLLERALLEREGERSGQVQLYGQDLSRVAYNASLENHQALSSLYPTLAEAVRFQKVDSTQAPWPRFDEVLMNLPFGLRVTGASGQRATEGELERLYFALFQQAKAHAKPHATLTAYTARRALLERASRAAGWRVMSAQSLWSGGLLVHLVSYRLP